MTNHAVQAARTAWPGDSSWLSSFCVSAVRGHPDSGILDASAMAEAEAARVVTTRSTSPLLVSRDSGYDGPQKVAATVRQMIRSGAAVCIEDGAAAATAGAQRAAGYIPPPGRSMPDGRCIENCRDSG